MTLKTISADWDYFQEASQPGWWAIQNPWNKPPLPPSPPLKMNFGALFALSPDDLYANGRFLVIEKK